jgi:hypothetical protein
MTTAGTMALAPAWEASVAAAMSADEASVPDEAGVVAVTAAVEAEVDAACDAALFL